MGKRILIADDGEDVRQVLRTLFTMAGLEICGEAATGREAVEKARQLAPDAILLDIAMPELNGVQAAAALAKLMPRVPVVLFTMYDETSSSLAAAPGVWAVVSKTDGLRKLLECVQGLITRTSTAATASEYEGDATASSAKAAGKARSTHS